MAGALPADERPLDPTPIHTDALPPTPIRDRNIPATAWVEAPDELTGLGDDLTGRPVATYKRRIGPWLLWRAGPAAKADARYWAADHRDLARQPHLPALRRRLGRGHRPVRARSTSGSAPGRKTSGTIPTAEVREHGAAVDGSSPTSVAGASGRLPKC